MDLTRVKKLLEFHKHLKLARPTAIMNKSTLSFFALFALAFCLSSNQHGWSQTLDLCDCVPAQQQPINPFYPSAIHGYPAYHSITTEQLISDQNQYLEQQFRLMASGRESMSLRMSALENRTSKSIEDLNGSIANLGNSQQQALKKLAQELRARDQKIVKELRAQDQQIAKQVERAFDSLGTISRDLVEVVKRSTDTTRSVVEAVGKAEGRYSSLQKQIRENSNLIARSLKLLSHQAELTARDREVSVDLFEALDKDLESIRQRISKMEKTGSGQHKKILSRLDTLCEIEIQLDKLIEQHAPKRKKKKKK